MGDKSPEPQSRVWGLSACMDWVAGDCSDTLRPQQYPGGSREITRKGFPAKG